MKKKAGILLFTIMILLSGCSGIIINKGGDKANEDNSAYKPHKIGSFDSLDTAVVATIQEEESTITLLNIETGKKYTLSYDGTTQIMDKYEEHLSMKQISQGDIVEVAFRKIGKQLSSLQISKDSWSNSDVEKFEIKRNGKSMGIGSSEYAIDEDAIIVSGEELVEWMDLNDKDMITVKGIGSTIHSVVIERGHGYLHLSNDEYFIGGWIEVGQALIQPITEEMMLVVPEGEYSVYVSNKGSGGVKQVNIKRNSEVELDIGDIEIAEAKSGKVFFSVTPSDATVYIDGKKIDTGEALTLEYGIHQMIVRAEGYKTITKYIKVGQEAFNVDVEMERTEEESVSDNDAKDKSTVSDNGVNQDKTTGSNSDNNQNSSVSGNITGTDNTVYNKVQIAAPVGVEVYLDGNYIGIAPTEFKKQAGSHTITLRKTGFETRSYTIQINEENNDTTLAFSTLESLN